MITQKKTMNFQEYGTRNLNDFSALSLTSTPQSRFQFGRSASITSTQARSIWDVALPYSYDSSAQYMQVSSSSGTDTNRSIKIVGLDANYNVATVTIALNGQTPVADATQLFIRVFGATNVGAGTLVGDVYVAVSGSTCTSGVPDGLTNVRAKILIGNEQSLMTQFAVPAGYRCAIFSISGSHMAPTGPTTDNISQVSVQMKTRTISFTGPFRTILQFEMCCNSFDKVFKEPLVFDQKTEFDFTALSLTAVLHKVSISVGYYLIKI